MDYSELQRWYRAAMSRRIEELRALRGPIRAGETEALDAARQIGQALRGSGATYGFPEVTAAASLLEASSDRHVLRRVEGLIVVLHRIASEGETGRGAGAEWLLAVADLDGELELLGGVDDVEGAWGRVCERAGLTPEALAIGAARYFDLDRAEGPMSVSRSALRLVPEALVIEAGVVPLREDASSIVIATSDPTSLHDEVEIGRLTGRTPVYVVATPEQLEAAFEAWRTASASSDAPTPPSAAPADPRPRDETRILVVDDDPMERVMLRGMLTKRDYAVLEAEDGVAALELLASDPEVDLVVSDLKMPEMDGLELIWTLRETTGVAHLPVIVVTGEEDPVLETLLLEEGAADYLRKPVDRRLFLSRVEASLRRFGR